MSDSIQKDLGSAIRKVTKKWKKAKRQADRRDRVSSYALRRMRYSSYRETIRDVAFRVMEAAYLKASDGGKYPANARQIYYAARPAILAEVEADKVDSRYFTQQILKDYLEQRSPDWDVVYDARGHLAEPHDGEVVGLGGIEVRGYIESFSGDFDEMPGLDAPERVPVKGPALRYSAVLFIEKEGFGPLLDAAHIAERFDLAIASTKGMPVSAFCNLLAELEEHECPVYVAHDFDKSGFSIVGSLRRGTRGSRGTGRVIDLGLRLEDIEGLQREPVRYSQGKDPAENLGDNGATEEEIAVLVQGGNWRSHEGERVELNAMTSGQFIRWLERKLKGQAIKKLVPERELIAKAYKRAVFLQALDERAEEVRKEIEGDSKVPRDIVRQVRALLKQDATQSWDQAVWMIAEARD